MEHTPEHLLAAQPMKKFLKVATPALIIIIAAPLAAFAQADRFADCHTLSDTDKRLACYDDMTGFQPANATKQIPRTDAVPPSSIGQQWTYSDEDSALDGRKDVWLSVESQNTQPNQIGGPESATLWVRCMKNSTNAFVAFNSYTSDNQTARYRFDDEKVRSIWMETMNGGDGIGLWSGGRAIPFIKSMFGKEKLVVGYNSYSSNNLEFTFDISGLRARIAPLAAACHWTP